MSDVEPSNFEEEEGGGESNFQLSGESWLGMGTEQLRVKQRKLVVEAIRDNKLWSTAGSPR